MIRLLCTASDRMEVWLSSDDAIRVKRLHENIRSLTSKIASIFYIQYFFLLGLDIIELLNSAIDACLFVYPGYTFTIIKIPSRDYIIGDDRRNK